MHATHYDRPGTERAEQYDPTLTERHAAAYAARHPEAVAEAPPAPLDSVRPVQGACRCPRDDSTGLSCTCQWDELLSAVMHLAYGANEATIASAGPAIATMAHDLIYRARNTALRDLAGQWTGSRTAFARAHNMSRSQLYNIID